MSQWGHDIQKVALVQAGHLARTLTHHGHEEPQLIVLTVNEINRDRSPEECFR